MFQKCEHCEFRNECAERMRLFRECDNRHTDTALQSNTITRPSMDVARHVIAQCTDLDDLIYDSHDGQPSTR